MSIRVKNREGILEPLNIKKIQEKTSAATEGLEGVSQSELEVDAQLTFFDGITTEQIQKSLIDTAVDKIDIDRPNWTFVAARLFLSDLYHKVGKELNNKKGQRYPKLETYLKRGEDEGRIVLGLRDKYDLNELDSYIKEERDLQFTYLGIKTMYDRYILKAKNDNPIELPQLLFMGVSMFIAQNETDIKSLDYLRKIEIDVPSNEELSSKYSGKDLEKAIRTIWAKTFYDTISTFDVMLATPTLSNARTPRHQLSSCYVGVTPDNIEGIFDAYKEQALLSKYGGGIGWDWNQVRGIGAYIDNHKNAAGGIIPFLKIENDIAIAVDQLGCVAKNSFVKVLTKVTTDNFEHNFRKEYEKYDFSEKELIEGVASYAEAFAFEYGKFSKNFIGSLLFDYIVNDKGHKFLEKIYGLSHDQYKKIIGKYKKINKGLPEGFETIKDYPEYAISKEGIVINVKSLKPISKIIDKKGYVRVTLGKKSIPLHKLLVKQFISANTKGLTINHIDGDKLNNSLDNLEIISNEENISLSWNEESKKKRTEMSRIRKHLSSGINLKGNRRDSHDFEIQDIEVEIIPIEKVRIGDLILSFDISKKESQFKPVISKHNISVKKEDQIKITYENGNYIITSVWHPTPKVIDDKIVYVRADSLEVGDKSVNDKKEEVKIIEITKPKVSEDFYDLSVRDNNNYFCSTENTDSEFHLIHNTRKGAIAVYIEPWHIDLLDFIDLKKNSGEERRRAHDLFPALWLNDLFMKRVSENGKWTLFNPGEVPELSNLYGEEFEKRYVELENDESIEFKEVYEAKELWKNILIQYFETGSPFLCHKDNANKRNPNKHSGIIRSSNLCVTGDTRLSTQFGLVKAEDLYKKNEELIASYDKRVCGNPEEYGVETAPCIEMHKTAENADIYKIKTKDGYEIKSTDWHEYYVRRGKEIIKIPLNEINIETDKLLIQSDKGQFGKEGSYKEGFSIAKNLKNKVPESIFKGNEEMISGFLDFFFKDKDEIFFKNIEILKDIQMILSMKGIHSYIENNILKIKNKPSFETEIVSIEYIGKEDVYDTTQLKNHSLIFNGLVTGNCTEIYQNTEPNKYKVKVEYNDGTIEYFDEEETIKTDEGVVKKGKKITSIDTINGKKVFFTEKVAEEGDTAVCNLASVNLSRVNTKEKIEKVVPIAIRMLDNVIDLNYYPVKKTKKANMKTRAIGLGVMGEAEMLATNKVYFGSNEHLTLIDEIMDNISFNAIKSSSYLAKEKGSYELFEGSDWSKGIMPFDTAKQEAKDLVSRESKNDWDSLRKEVQVNGIRNGYLMAIAPTSSISILVGTTQAIEPVYKRKWFEENLSGLIPVVVPKLTADTWQYYETAYELDQLKLVRAGAVRQKWIDQGQSLNIFIRLDIASAKLLNDIYMEAWKLGLKSNYYLRSESPKTEEEMSVADRSIECMGCQ